MTGIATRPPQWRDHGKPLPRAKLALGSVTTALETAQQEIAFLRAADGKENEGGPW